MRSEGKVGIAGCGHRGRKWKRVRDEGRGSVDCQGDEFGIGPRGGRKPVSTTEKQDGS